MTTENERWCRLNRRLEVGSEKFEAGEIFRVAHCYQRENHEVLLTLDGNEDSFHWSSALVIHNVPASAVTFLQDVSVARSGARSGSEAVVFKRPTMWHDSDKVSQIWSYPSTQL